MSRACLLLSVLLVASCGGDEASPDAASGDPIDAAAGGIDAAGATDGGGGGIDAAGAPDANADVDASTSGLGPVDCRVEADCPGLSSCNLDAPGGVCLGCGTDDDCPAGTSCGQVGACVRDCIDDGDCSAGKRCTASGLCAIRSCGPSQDCPAPYVCGGTLCARPACDGGTCPAPLVCGTDDVCVEP